MNLPEPPEYQLETPRPVYSFVLPIYNEEQTLPELRRRMSAILDQLDGPAEVIMVDDGSRDRSYALMQDIQQTDSRYKTIQFSRNFGHQLAITAGMDFAVGRAIIIMDADLQDPPEVALEMAARWREGYEVVYAVREEREGETWFKRKTAEVFYRIQRRMANIDIPVNVGDFRLVDRRALDAFLSLRENNRYVRGMFSWIGFKQTGVTFVRSSRYAGTPQYTFVKSLKLAIDALISFSYAPLRLALMLGLFVSLLSVIYGLFAVCYRVFGGAVPGWASLAALISFLGGLQLMVLGVVAEYLGRIYDEVKDRPLYIVRETGGLSPTNSAWPNRTTAYEAVIPRNPAEAAPRAKHDEQTIQTAERKPEKASEHL